MYCQIFDLISSFLSNKWASGGSFFKLGLIPCKAEQPLQGMELQEKEAQKD